MFDPHPDHTAPATLAATHDRRILQGRIAAESAARVALVHEQEQQRQRLSLEKKVRQEAIERKIADAEREVQAKQLARGQRTANIVLTGLCLAVVSLPVLMAMTGGL